MEIAVLIHPFGRYGGAERLAVLHALGLAKKGYKVSFYTDPNGVNQSWLKPLERLAEIRELPYGLRARSVLQELERFQRVLIHHHIEPVAAFMIAKACRRKTYWYTGEPPRAIWEHKITREDYRRFSPTVFHTARHFYGPVSRVALWGPLYNFTTAFLRMLDSLTVRNFPTIIANSQYTANLVKEIYHYRGRLVVVYPSSGIPSAMFHPTYSAGDYVLAVGALMPNKNFDAILKAMSLTDNPPPLRIIGDGQEKPRLSTLAHHLNVDVEFRPSATNEELCTLYEGSLFAIVPSLAEPFGMTVVEAALAGKPSIVTEYGGTKEFVTDNETGLVVNPREPKDIALAIGQLLQDGKLRQVMGQTARARALSKFTLDGSIDSLTEALDLN
jgi:glycosyltransferase involved in cell wall biosynthesis